MQIIKNDIEMSLQEWLFKRVLFKTLLILTLLIILLFPSIIAENSDTAKYFAVEPIILEDVFSKPVPPKPRPYFSDASVNSMLIYTTYILGAIALGALILEASTFSRLVAYTVRLGGENLQYLLGLENKTLHYITQTSQGNTIKLDLTVDIFNRVKSFGIFLKDPNGRFHPVDFFFRYLPNFSRRVDNFNADGMQTIADSLGSEVDHIIRPLTNFVNPIFESYRQTATLLLNNGWLDPLVHETIMNSEDINVIAELLRGVLAL